MKRVLLIGNGGREHALAESLKRSPQECDLGVFANAVNPGMKALASSYHVAPSLLDFEELQNFASSFHPDFAFVGPDDPIAEGAADVLLELGIRTVAPLRALARVESSKSFTRLLMEKYKISGNPRFKVFTSSEGLRSFIEELGEYVVKADGLMGGKGVKVSGEHLNTVHEGVAYAEECIEKSGRVVVEEKLIGQEFSLMSFVDGLHLVDMPAVQDHKRAFEGDSGPNTGGMGSYSDSSHSLPFLGPNDLKQAHAITEAVVAALYKETGLYYQGILYGGFIAVKDGVRLIEFNARFGDPEAMNVLPLLKTDFIDVCEAILNQTLDTLPLSFEQKATVVKYVVPEGYPTNPKKGEKIELGPVPEGVKLYYASVNAREDGLYLSSSRALAFVGISDSISEAEQLSENAVSSVKGPVFYRKDIGTAPLIQKRVEHMKELRKFQE